MRPMEKEIINDQTIQSLRSEIRPEIFAKALGLFVNELDNAGETIPQLFENKDWQTLNRQAHSIKGSAMSFGAEPLRDAAYQVEQQAEGLVHGPGSSTSLQSLSEGVQTLLALMEKTKKHLRVYL